MYQVFGKAGKLDDGIVVVVDKLLLTFHQVSALLLNLPVLLVDEAQSRGAERLVVQTSIKVCKKKCAGVKRTTTNTTVEKLICNLVPCG